MGVDRSDYLVYGWKLGYPEDDEMFYEDEKYLSMIEGHPGEKYSLIMDGMCGEYIVFGNVISEADEYTGWEFQDIILPEIIDLELISKYREIFGTTPQYEPKLFLFTHFS